MLIGDHNVIMVYMNMVFIMGYFGSCSKNLGISDVKSLEAGEDAELFWVHSDHTHWLLDLHGNSVTVVTSTTDALSLTSQLDQLRESVRVGVRWEDGDEGSWVQVVIGEEGEELSGRVKFTHKRGRPLQVHTHTL